MRNVKPISFVLFDSCVGICNPTLLRSIYGDGNAMIPHHETRYGSTFCRVLARFRTLFL